MEELYTLDREVGRGSYGVVFEGHMSRTGSRVAIKRLPCCNPECIELYLQELWAMRATAKNHPNVIALHGCLLQTGARTLKPLKPGRLPLDLVETTLKGSVVGARARANLQARAKLRDRTNLEGSATRIPLRPPNGPRKRAWHQGANQENVAPGGGARGCGIRQRSQGVLDDGGEPEEVPGRCLALWLVMEFCDGGDLNQYLLSRPPDATQNHSVVKQMSSAVAFLHRLGITHRDLKPANVLVRDGPTGPVVKVADFGLSKMSEGLAEGSPGRKHFSSTCGSDFYMAPEVWGGLSYSAQADIFSLGVLFWAVLERITFLEEGTSQEQLGAYACKGRSAWLMPLGEALLENPGLRLCIPMKSRRAPPLPPPPGPSMCRLLHAMLAADPDARPPGSLLEGRVRVALMEDERWLEQQGTVQVKRTLMASPLPTARKLYVYKIKADDAQVEATP